MRAEAERIVRCLREHGHEAVFAGGCVRDELRGAVPGDYDIATSALPDEVRALFPGSQAVGAHFGVIIVRAGGHSFEVATFREDGAYRDGRRPETVRFTTAEHDARRRDFTVNGLFLDPLDGRVIDHVGGRVDLENRMLRAIGDPVARFREDHLRLMRAVRFATVLRFEIEAATWAAILDEAPSLAHISIERVRDELVKILLDSQRVRGFDLLCDSGLMAQVIPEILALRGCEQPPEFHPEGDVFVHTRAMLGLLPETASVPLVFSVLLHDIAKPATRVWDPAVGRIRFNEHDRIGAEMTGAILRRLRFSNDMIDATVEMVSQHMTFMHVQRMRPARLRRFMSRGTFPDELELHRVDCQSSHGMLDNLEFLRAKQDEFASEPLIPPRLVDGHDLMGIGIPRGPQLGRLLEEVQTLQLEGKLTTRDEALAWAAGQIVPKPAP